MKAQGSMEYLIIIAALIAIAGVVIVFMTGAFGQSKSSAELAACKTATSNCGKELATSPDATCTYCEDECKAFPLGIDLCKQGKTKFIY